MKELIGSPQDGVKESPSNKSLKESEEAVTLGGRK